MTNTTTPDPAATAPPDTNRDEAEAILTRWDEHTIEAAAVHAALAQVDALDRQTEALDCMVAAVDAQAAAAESAALAELHDDWSGLVWQMALFSLFAGGAGVWLLDRGNAPAWGIGLVFLLAFALAGTGWTLAVMKGRGKRLGEHQ